jgi:hypothetical protein
MAVKVVLAFRAHTSVVRSMAFHALRLVGRPITLTCFPPRTIVPIRVALLRLRRQRQRNLDHAVPVQWELEGGRVPGFHSGTSRARCSGGWDALSCRFPCAPHPHPHPLPEFSGRGNSGGGAYAALAMRNGSRRSGSRYAIAKGGSASPSPRRPLGGLTAAWWGGLIPKYTSAGDAPPKLW